MVGNPIDRKYKDKASNKLLPNFPITPHDITNANSMFVPDLLGVKGNVVGNKPSMVETQEYMNTPEYFYKLHKFMTLAVNVMFVNRN